jgi:hypothetical protein
MPLETEKFKFDQTLMSFRYFGPHAWKPSSFLAIISTALLLGLLGAYVIPPNAAATLFLAPAALGLFFILWCDLFDIVSGDIPLHWTIAITIVLAFSCAAPLILFSGPMGWSIPLSATFIFLVLKIFGQI